ncbi:glycosyltransferase family 4 protein [Zhouia sp. PK063]|uniref:glycosyltransferase family 4 protein n=1 Tax=Zhouia sp. PK063 TaxID=3373602 RepID=UPI0037979EC8
MVKIHNDISSRVLTIGSQYKNHRGGIGGVIDTYSKHFESFKYICSYGTTTSMFKIIINFLSAIYKTITCLIKDKEIEIIHIHGAARGSVYRKYILFKICKYFFNKKIIFHCHGSEMEKFYTNGSKFVKYICTNFFNNVDLILCLSPSWKEFFIKNFRPKDIVVLENIVEEADLAKKRNTSSSVIEFLFLGAIGKRKGIFDLLEVLKENKSELEGKITLTVGGNGEVEKFTSFIAINKLETLVNFKGWISGKEKKDLLLTSHVYILPSYNEGLPISILEAMSYQMPIISTDVGGISEVVENNYNGCLIEAGDQEAIYKSLKLFIENPALVQEYGIHSERKVQPYYTKNVIPKLESIYTKLLSS